MTPSAARPGSGPLTPLTPLSARRPPALRPGDRVAVLSVSSPAPPQQLAVGLDVLRFAGLDPVVYPSARDQGSMRRYLAGDDRMRAADLRAALSDDEFAALSSHYDDAKIFEIILLCGFYRTVSYLANGLALPLEEKAARFPKVVN